MSKRNSKAADTEKFSYKESLKNLMRNKNYIVFLFATGSIWGAYNVMAIVLDPLIEPFGFTSVTFLKISCNFLRMMSEHSVV